MSVHSHAPYLNFTVVFPFVQVVFKIWEIRYILSSAIGLKYADFHDNAAFS